MPLTFQDLPTSVSQTHTMADVRRAFFFFFGCLDMGSLHIVLTKMCSSHNYCLVAGRGRVVLRTDNKSPAPFRAAIDSLNDTNQLLLVLQDSVELVVVTGTKIAHHMLVEEEEHIDGDGIV